MKLLMLFVGLAAGNFVYSMLTGAPHSVAIERTYFQGLALFCAWLMS